MQGKARKAGGEGKGKEGKAVARAGRTRNRGGGKQADDEGPTSGKNRAAAGKLSTA